MIKIFTPTILLTVSFCLLSCDRTSPINQTEKNNYNLNNISVSNYSTLSKDLKWMVDLIDETRNQDPKKGLFYASQLIEAAQKTGNQVGESLGYYKLGYIYDEHLVMYINALTNYFISLQKTNNLKSISYCNLRIGGIYYKVGLYNDALSYYRKFLDASLKLSDKKDEATAYRSIALVYRNLGNSQVSISYLQKALTIYEALGNKSQIADCYNSLATTYYIENKYKEAKEYYLKALTIREVTKDVFLTEIYFNLSLVYAKLNDFKTGLEYLNLSLQVSKEINYLSGIADANFEIANTYYKQKAYQQSISELNKALIVAEQLQDKISLINITQLFSDCYHAIGDQNKAREYEDKNAILKEDYRLDQMKAIQIQNQQRNEVERFSHGKFIQTESDPKHMIWFIAILVGLISGAGVTLLGIKRKVKIVETPMIKLRDPKLVDLSWWHMNQLKWIEEEARESKKLIQGIEAVIKESLDKPTKEVVQVILAELKERLKTIHYWSTATNDVDPTPPPKPPNN